MICDCGTKMLSDGKVWTCPYAGNKYIHPREHPKARVIADEAPDPTTGRGGFHLAILSDYPLEIPDKRMGVQR